MSSKAARKRHTRKRRRNGSTTPHHLTGGRTGMVFYKRPKSKQPFRYTSQRPTLMPKRVTCWIFEGLR